MLANVEVRDLRVFLALADELHFGRAAERLGLTSSRVSQIVRGLERKLGGQLVYRTSRRVQLTALGEQFRDEAGNAYTQLSEVVDRIITTTRNRKSVIRLGLFSEPSARTVRRVVRAFETRHPECEVQISESPLGDVFGPLLRDEVDLLVGWLPHGRPGIVTGPILAREPRVLAVGRDHPLAQRTSVSVEDLADYPVFGVTGPSKELREAWIPSRTPKGRIITRHGLSDRAADDRGWLIEATYLIAAARVVHPTVPNAFADPNILYVPIRGLPKMRAALLWRRRLSDPTVREFIRTARDVKAAPAQG